MKFRYRDFEYCSHFFDEYRRIFFLLLWMSFEEKLFCTMCRCSTSVRLFVWLDSCNHMIRSYEHYISTIISSNEPNTKSTEIFIQFCLAIFDSICEIYTSQFFVDQKFWYCFEWKHCQIKACVNNTRSIWKNQVMFCLLTETSSQLQHNKHYFGLWMCAKTLETRENNKIIAWCVSSPSLTIIAALFDERFCCFGSSIWASVADFIPGKPV